MARCDSCGNDYDKAFQVIAAGKTMTCGVTQLRDRA